MATVVGALVSMSDFFSSRKAAGTSRRAGWMVALVAVFLAGCAATSSAPDAPKEFDGRTAKPGRGGGYHQGDGPPKSLPRDIDRIPDAEPQVETPLARLSKPYEVLGRRYAPLSGDPEFRQRGIASWYGNKFHGRPTASGEPYDMFKMTAAHPTLPIPSYVRVRHVGNGRQVIVRVNDRGPFHGNRAIDLSYVAARRLGVLDGGSALVEIERLTNEAIRAGAWRTDEQPRAESQPPAASFPVATGLAPLSPQALPAVDAPASRGADVAGSAPSAGFWVQLGAFSQREGAERFQRQVATQLAALAPQLLLRSDASLYKLQAGPYRSRQEADSAARQVREQLQLVPLVLHHR